MERRCVILVGFIILFLFSLSCAPSRLEMDYGTSFKLMRLNQTFDPDAEKDNEPVTGLDGKAAQASIEKYRKDFEKPAPPTPFTLTIGTLGKK